MDWVLGWKMVSSCKFRAALVSALISINFVLFGKVSQNFLAKMVAILDIGVFITGNLFLTNSIVFDRFEIIYLEVNIYGN